MAASKSFTSLKKCLAHRLGEQRFVAVGDLLSRRAKDVLAVLEIQKDIKRSTKESILFTIELGVCIDVLYKHATGGLPAIDVPPTTAKCHWRIRLGRLLLTPSDRWWSICEEVDIQVLCERISEYILRFALPKLEEIGSSEALFNLWKNGVGQGLTEYERRSNLAMALCLLGRTDEAYAAIEELEKSTLGKSWEGAAKYTTNELQKMLSS